MLEKLRHINPYPLAVIFLISSVGFVLLFSAGGSSLMPWALKQFIRFMVGMGVLLMVASIDIRFYFRVAYIFYAVTFILLILVELMGFVGMGAQRWIDLYIIQIQPSELMKVALVLALARYFHELDPSKVSRIKSLILPVLMMALPALLVIRQPDLGTALVLLMVGACLMFLAGLSLWYFIAAGVVAASSIPVLWSFLHDYQKQRVLTFFDPGRDPLGTGYHITQSKIALGSGGFFGRGYGQGTQAALNFLPEKQTDFIFTMFCEEYGFMGALGLISLYVVLIMYGVRVAMLASSTFSRLVAWGITFSFFIYMFVNMSMVIGLLPVVGVPLPLVSYGGTAMLTLLMGFGLLFCVDLHRSTKLPQKVMSLF